MNDNSVPPGDLKWYGKLLLELLKFIDGDFRTNLVMDACYIIFFGIIASLLIFMTPKVKYMDVLLAPTILIVLGICLYMIYDCHKTLQKKINSGI